MQLNDATIRGGDYLAVDREAPEDDQTVDMSGTKYRVLALSAGDVVGIGYDLILRILISPSVTEQNQLKDNDNEQHTVASVIHMSS